MYAMSVLHAPALPPVAHTTRMPLQVSVFFALLWGLALCMNPSLSELRGPVYAEELARCLPTDMHRLVTDTLEDMADLQPEQAPGTAGPLDKLGWYAQMLTKLMTGGRGFCEAYSMTTSMAVSRFSDHAFHGNTLREYRQACKARLAASTNPYAHALGLARGASGPMLYSNDPLVKCLLVGSNVVEQTRLAEPSRPEK